MIQRILDFIRGPDIALPFWQREKLFFDTGPDHVYAIGDVHGCDDVLGRLEALIEADCDRLEGTKWLIMLGDYVDRGPRSASVIERLATKPDTALRRFCLAGNHEEVMLDFIRNPAPDHRWLDFGGRATLCSYGIHSIPDDRDTLKAAIQKCIPQEHVCFLEALPSLVGVPGYCFVHAGIDRGIELADQKDATLLWTRPRKKTRSPPLTAATSDLTVVHGHTPVKAVEIGADRINVDTGAFMSGVLSAVRLSRSGEVKIFQCSSA